jgi:hypothetical protein
MRKAGAAQEVVASHLASSFDTHVRQRAPHICSVEYLPMAKGLREAGWKD